MTRRSSFGRLLPKIGHHAPVPTLVEFWPESTGRPIWSEGGVIIELSTLPLPPRLEHRLTVWNSKYDDSKLPYDQNDDAWLSEGQALLSEVRSALGSEFNVIVTEPWWGEQSSD